MKRVVSLVAALALAVGAFAPAAFASDVGYGQTDLIPLEDLDQETFDTYLKKFYSQDYPTYGVLDLIRDTFQGGLSNASGVNDSVWSWALNLVDNAGDIGTEIGLWLQGVEIDPNTGKAIYPDDYLTDYAKQQLDSQLKSAGSLDVIDTGSGVWVATPYKSSQGNWYVYCSTSYSPNYSVGVAYTTVLANGYSCTATYYTSGYAGLFSYSSQNPSGSPSSVSGIGNSYTYNGSHFYYFLFFHR